MIMPEILKKLCELQLKLKDNGGPKIHDISTIQDGDYGYVFALTTCKGSVHDELLSAKLSEMRGKQLFPDLWMFGPCLKENNETKT